jgi:PadR family transcriptional regulator, regulatory protein PadR
MGSRKYLGEFERLILLAILRLHGDAYGMRIRMEIKERSNRLASLGAIYTTLERLEAKGMVSSWVGDPTPERGGRAKKFFKLEAAGQQALRQAEEVTAAMSVPFPLSVVPHA